MEKKLMQRISDKIMRDGLIYTIVLLVILLVGYVVGNSVIWYGDEPLYPMLQWMSENAVLTGLFFWIVGLFIILIRYLCYMGGLIESMSRSARLVVKDDDTQIELPDELAGVQLELNDIKNQIRLSRFQAKEAEQRKNDLVVYLAHDLKTPLTSVMGYLMLLQEEPDISKEMRQKYLDIVVRKAERLEQLINEFFEITRFNLTTMELEKSRVDFGRLLEQTIYEFQPMLEQKSMTCRLNAAQDLMVLCDGDKMQRVVDNLLRNSILYGYEGTEIVVNVAIGEEEKMILTCTNRGAAIPKEKLERIFDQFYRLDSARSTSTGGSGLGLAIAKEIVRLHGGTITAQSEVEVTTFRVELPLKA